MTNVVHLRDYDPKPKPPKSWDEITMDMWAAWFPDFMPWRPCVIHVFPERDTAPSEMNPHQDSA